MKNIEPVFSVILVRNVDNNVCTFISIKVLLDVSRLSSGYDNYYDTAISLKYVQEMNNYYLPYLFETSASATRF